jgi:hypothetical protein
MAVGTGVTAPVGRAGWSMMIVGVGGRGVGLMVGVGDADGVGVSVG